MCVCVLNENMTNTTYSILIRDNGAAQPPDVRLRRLLKAAGRRHGFTVVEVRDVAVSGSISSGTAPEAGPPQALPRCGRSTAESFSRD